MFLNQNKTIGLLIAVFFLLNGSISLAQFRFSFSDSLAIPDDNNWHEYPISVSNLEPMLTESFGVSSVMIDINHPHIDDLIVKLRSPWGKEVTLAYRHGYTGANYNKTTFSSFKNPPLELDTAPFSQIYRPRQSLAHFNTSQNPNGIWKLLIRDVAQWNIGTVNAWHIEFSESPVKFFPFNNSNLPILAINTKVWDIPYEEKTEGFLKVVHSASSRNMATDTAFAPALRMGIEIRGSSSASFPKKSYSIEFTGAKGEDTAVALCGMPAESDWVLTANFADKSMLRNAFTYQLARTMGFYAPRTRFVELILNNEYHGVYVLTESIKRGPDRVNIARLRNEDTLGTDVTGGYILKVDKTSGQNNDWFESEHPPIANPYGQKILWQYHYPRPDVINLSQKTYIQAFIRNFENKMMSADFADPVSGYRAYINLNSFLDMVLINEWSKNVDGYRASTFFTKPKNNQNNGRLIAGPVWDYDLAWHNANFCGNESVEGWLTEDFHQHCDWADQQTPSWWARLRSDSAFNVALSCRWAEMAYSRMNEENLDAWFSAAKAELFEAQERNFDYWPIMGKYVWPNTQPIPQTWDEEIEKIKQWMRMRKEWMSSRLQSPCLVGIQPELDAQAISLSPNPTGGIVVASGLPASTESLNIYYATGGLAAHVPVSEGKFSIRFLPPGLYLAKVPGSFLPPMKLVRR